MLDHKAFERPLPKSANFIFSMQFSSPVDNALRLNFCVNGTVLNCIFSSE